MSEELKEKATDFLVGRGDYFKSGLPISTKIEHVVYLLAEFASQVCEQREKEHASTCCGDAHGDLAAFQDRMEAIGVSVSVTVENGVRVRHIKNTGAEAAELALQTSQREFSQCNLRLDVEYQRAEGLEADLKAQEQELLAIQSDVQNLADVRAELSQLKDRHELLNNVVAQARQQAIAECARIVFDEGYEAVAHRLRSLTPPPALTPKIERRVGKERRDPAGTQPYSWKNGRKGERRKKFPSLTKEK